MKLQCELAVLKVATQNAHLTVRLAVPKMGFLKILSYMDKCRVYATLRSVHISCIGVTDYYKYSCFKNCLLDEICICNTGSGQHSGRSALQFTDLPC